MNLLNHVTKRNLRSTTFIKLFTITSQTTFTQKLYNNKTLILETSRKCTTKIQSISEIIQNLYSCVDYDNDNYHLVCIKTLRQLGQKGDVQGAKDLMKSILKLNKINLITLKLYNTLFNVFSINDCIWESEYFIDEMIGIYGIVPNIFTVNILLRGCLQKAKFKFAQKIWNNMIIKYHLKPNISTYRIMINIYANSGKTKQSEKLIIDMIINRDIIPNRSVYCSLMKAYSETKDIKMILKLRKFMEKQNISIGLSEYILIMTCYLKNDQYSNALSVYNEYITTNSNSNSSRVRVSDTMITLQLSAYCGLMMISVNQKEKEYYFNLINQNVSNSKQPISNSLSNIQLSAATEYYNNIDDWNKILNIFEGISKQNKIVFNYWTNDGLSIDMHKYGYNVCKFLIEYIFKYEKNNILNMNEIKILCGRATHRDKHSSILNSTHQGYRGIRQFIARELLKFSPPIRSQNDKAFLILNRKDVVQYFNQKNETCNNITNRF